jgi:hypothetical protein
MCIPETDRGVMEEIQILSRRFLGVQFTRYYSQKAIAGNEIECLIVALGSRFQI